MQNTIQKFRQSSIVFKKQGILSENLKTLTSFNCPTVQYFLLKLYTRFLLTNVYKSVCGIFFIHLDLELFAKISTHSLFALLLITQDLNKIKKSHTPFCRHYQVENVCKLSAKNIKLYGIWNLSKFSIFQTKILVSWGLPKFRYRILHNLKNISQRH